MLTALQVALLEQHETALRELHAVEHKTPQQARQAISLRRRVRAILRGPEGLCCVCWKQPSDGSMTGLRCAWCAEYGAPFTMYPDAPAVVGHRRPRAKRRYDP